MRDDYYNSEQHMNAVYLPKYNKEKPLCILVSLIQVLIRRPSVVLADCSHCLIPQPKHILIDRDENGILATEVFSKQQTSEDVLKILGYEKNSNIPTVIN